MGCVLSTVAVFPSKVMFVVEIMQVPFLRTKRKNKLTPTSETLLPSVTVCCLLPPADLCCPLMTSVAPCCPLLPPVVLLPSAALCLPSCPLLPPADLCCPLLCCYRLLPCLPSCPLLPSGAGWMGLMVTDVDACDELTSCFPAT